MGGRAYRIWKLLCEGMEQKIQAPSRTGEVTRYFFLCGVGLDISKKCGLAYVDGEESCEGRGNKQKGFWSLTSSQSDYGPQVCTFGSQHRNG